MDFLQTRNQISALLEDAISEQNLYLDEPVDLSQGEEALLYGEKGNLDSLSLITIIADIERKVESEFGIRVKLANEQDLTLADSRFSTLGKMTDFIVTKIGVENRQAS